MAATIAAAPGVALGFGNFGSAETVTTGGIVYGLAVGDVNRDGKADVVAANDGTITNSISILPGKGNGKFKPEETIDATGAPDDVAIAKLAGDNRPDLAVANYDASAVWLLRGMSGGGFEDDGTLPAGPGAWRIAVADLDRDGDQDIVTGNYDNTAPDEAISVLLGDGDGFQTAVDYDGGQRVMGLATGRMNGDKRPDVVAATDDGLVSVYRANANGTLDDPEQIDLETTLGEGYDAVALADFDRDGNLDVAVSIYQSNQVAIVRGRGDGGLKQPIFKNLTVGPNGIAAGDLNRDGKADVAVNGYAENKMVTLLGKGNGKLKAPREKNASDAPESIAIGKLNGDAGLDVVLGTDTGVDAFLNK